MKVRRFFRPSTACVEPWDNLREAARRMRNDGLSCLPVLIKGEVTGIVTERDLVEAMADGERPADAQVFDYMSEGPVTVSIDDDSSVAAARMLAVGCRHLPVMDAGQLVGTVSAQDLLMLAARPGVQAPGTLLQSRATAAVGDARAVASGDWPEEPPPDVDSEG
jgi:CBS domain-containing protein